MTDDLARLREKVERYDRLATAAADAFAAWLANTTDDAAWQAWADAYDALNPNNSEGFRAACALLVRFRRPKP